MEKKSGQATEKAYKSPDEFEKNRKFATFLQTARCTVVKQPDLAAPHSELVGGGH